MDKDTLKMTMLLDFYGEMLTGKQREYMEMYYNEDLSLFEIAEREEISRQGVHDILVRAQKKLLGIEKKTGIVQRWNEARAALELAAQEGSDMHPAVAEYFHMENQKIGI